MSFLTHKQHGELCDCWRQYLIFKEKPNKWEELNIRDM